MQRFHIWDGAYPHSDDIQAVQASYYSICHTPDIFQHGVALAAHNGRFFATFGRNAGQENSSGEQTVCYISDDAKRWRFHSVMGEPPATGGRSHGILFQMDGSLFAYNARFSDSAYAKPGSPEIIFPGLATDAFRFDDASGQWLDAGCVAEDFWPMNPPVNAGEQYLIPGINGHFQSAYLLGNAKQGFVKYDTAQRGAGYTETACVAYPDALTLYIRNSRPDLGHGDGRYLAAATSADAGESWVVGETDLFESNSKPCAGMLSDGRAYLVSNSLPGQGYSRAFLTISLSKPGERRFSSMRLIRRGAVPDSLLALYSPQTVQAGFSYPCSLEYNGTLYVAYSSSGGAGSNHNRIELAAMDIRTL